jgi:hypothetical protein
LATTLIARPDGSEWTVKEVVGHVIDAERIFAHRAFRFARGDSTPLPGFDENAYVPAAKFGRRSLDDLVVCVPVACRRLLAGGAWAMPNRYEAILCLVSPPNVTAHRGPDEWQSGFCVDVW